MQKHTPAKSGRKNGFLVSVWWTINNTPSTLRPISFCVSGWGFVMNSTAFTLA